MGPGLDPVGLQSVLAIGHLAGNEQSVLGPLWH